MRLFRRLLLVILLTVPTVKYAQSRIVEERADNVADQADEVQSEIDAEDYFMQEDDRVSTQSQVNQAGGRVYVYYGTGQHRPYHNRRYYYHRKGYPYGPYYYRYYYYPYQRPTRFYKRGW